MTDKQ